MPSAHDVIAKILDAASRGGVIGGEPRAIQGGAQVEVALGPERGVLRVYAGKKGIKVDLSQLRAETLRRAIEEVAGVGLPAPARASGVPDLSGAEAVIGSDEAGKGDYFGSLVVAAVRVPRAERERLAAIGVRDSKEVTDGTAVRLYESITEALPVAVRVYPPPDYNRLHAATPNVNTILARAHAECIAELAKLGEAEVLVDRFADPAPLRAALRGLGSGAKVRAVPRAEGEIAVAAASIVARALFLQELDRLGIEAGMELPKGAGSPVEKAARDLFRREGREAVARVAKMHFKTTQRVCRG